MEITYERRLAGVLPHIDIAGTDFTPATIAANRREQNYPSR
jgi:hypothetical protein